MYPSGGTGICSGVGSVAAVAAMAATLFRSKVYDSLAPALTSNLFQQVATSLATISISISLKYVDVTM